MEKQQIYNTYVQILHEELLPALGCTEPIAIALAGAAARKALGVMPERVLVQCSRNILKNAMGVTVPGTGSLKGVDTSAVLGAVAGDADKQLEVLAGITEQDIDITSKFLKEGKCKVELLPSKSQLHIIVNVFAGDNCASVEIRDSHTNIVNIIKNGETIFTKEESAEDKAEIPANEGADKSCLNLADIFDFATTAPIEPIKELLEQQIAYNSTIAKEGLEHPYGAQVGRTLAMRGNDTRTMAKAMPAAGSDARMGGCILPVVINSGSGNQGMTVTLPVLVYANSLKADHETTLRALTLSNLVALLQKREIGKLSAYCGAVSAACGSGAAITWLSGGTFQNVADTITNTIANTSGIVCDGAKASCAAKIATSVESAIMAHEMAMNNNVFKSGEGIVKDSVEQTILGVGELARDGMRKTDEVILGIMTK